MNATDRRYFATALELRARPAGGVTLAGHAAVYGVESEPIAGLFRERILPGAFRRALAEGADVRALVGHDPNLVLGRRSAGTLRLAEDARGLAVEIDLPETSYGRDLAESVRRGDIDGMSFGFRATAQKWTPATRSGELPVRDVSDLDLVEVSAVAFPAYRATDLSVRAAGALEAWAERERLERERRAEKLRAFLGK